MAYVLRLDSGATQRIIRKQGLAAAQRLGRGAFCAVYQAETPDAVWKLTADGIQRDSALYDFEGDYFPRLLEDRGYVGDQSNTVPLYLFKAERLMPLRMGSAAVRAEARLLNKQTDIAWNTALRSRKGGLGLSVAYQRQQTGLRALEMLQENSDLSAGLRDAIASVYQVVSNYDNARLDMCSANLMVRDGTQLVLNDVICDCSLL